jgi:hypothetical protein
MVKLNNLEVACLFLLLHGPARAATIQKAMWRYIKGPIVGPGPFRWYAEYFRPNHTTYGDSIPASRYVTHTASMRNVKTALWHRDDETLMWSLTELGKAKAYGAKWKLETGKNCRIRVFV